VAGWQCYQSKDHITAVRMVLITCEFEHYWLSSGGFRERLVFCFKKKKKKKNRVEWHDSGCGIRSGSGWVAVVPIERGYQCGHF
jgi:hypothetical protein